MKMAWRRSAGVGSRARPTGATQTGGGSDWGRLKSMQPLPSPTCVGYAPTLKCALARLRRSSPSTGLGWRRTSPAVYVHVVRDAAWRSIARLRRSAPSTGLDARPHASPVYRAPFRSRKTSSSGAVRPDRAFHLVARSVHGRAALLARTAFGRQPRRRPEAIRLRGASPSGAAHARPARPDRAFHLVARSVHGRAALVAHTPSGRPGWAGRIRGGLHQPTRRVDRETHHTAEPRP